MDVVNTSSEEAVGVFKASSEEDIEAGNTSLGHQVRSEPVKKPNVDKEMKEEEVEADIQEMNPSQALVMNLLMHKKMKWRRRILLLSFLKHLLM